MTDENPPRARPSWGRNRTNESAGDWKSQRTSLRKFSNWGSSRSSSSSQPNNNEQPQTPEVIPDSYPTYDLDWEDLHKFLLDRWPGRTFVRHVEKDRYMFELPYPGLSEEHRREISNLRKRAFVRGQSSSPEPES
ncbi:hypothetical protein QBC43DRAFT_313473 [Cladorrhinum sp. PSN259]|nr:hypothetical protein QBC43DRAFT_313473 [Cladorrhinum sp. PSN259]